MKTVVKYLRPHFSQMSIGLTIKFLGSIMDLFLPWILAYIIDTVVPQKNVPSIIFWGVMMILASIIALVTNIVANRIAAKVSRDTTQKLRSDLFHKIFTLSGTQVDRHSIPSLISRLTSDTYHVHQMINMMQRMGVRAPILLIGGIIITLTLDVSLALVLLSTIPLIGFVIYYISKKGLPLYKKLQEGIDNLTRTVRENIVGIRVIKALSKTDYEKNRFNMVNNDVVAREKKAGTTMAVTSPLVNLILNLGLIFVLIVGAYRVDLGLTQVGKIIAFMTYFTLILNVMLAINRLFIMYTKGSASATRISEILNDVEDLKVLPTDKIESDYHIVFNNVSFSYLKLKDNVCNISFKLKKGETLGIIGGTGSGKSTIINLLMRLYDIDSGEIRIDGQTVNSIPPDILHKKFGIVFQNDSVFADTISENISFGREFSASETEKAVAFSQALEFTKEKVGGLSHSLTIKGMNLSGGQKQRLLIARALYGNPEILILDDSSSALDYKTDSKLRNAIKENFSNTTTIIVAQRVSSILHSDHILVLEDGKEIGYGKHEDLLQNCESYREIANLQMGGGIS